MYNSYALGECDAFSLPYFVGRVGFRSKLLSVSKLKDGKPLGRCVVMLDALEQAASSPLYNALTSVLQNSRSNPLSGFRNTVVRASSDWLGFWAEVREAAVIFELDWKKFDRERPAEDIDFFVDAASSLKFLYI
ncbi:unnamed protein product [Sphenostylis stenocarpa]|uniref:Uncharacterized protein n=1 Tax=Sphenostylis stenocarpa TaxID=92480 RepID=A0AA86VSG8_9FABA|nr:unnamed protein product [Sphenostylis stenocarpa]